jgi:predicted transcriptional regulator
MTILRYNPHTEGAARWFPPTEARVMSVLWEAECPLIIRVVHKRVAQGGKRIAYTTVATTMNRLVEKGFLTRALRPGNLTPYVYSPTETREAFEARQVAALLESLARENTTEIVQWCQEHSR